MGGTGTHDEEILAYCGAISGESGKSKKKSSKKDNKKKSSKSSKSKKTKKKNKTTKPGNAYKALYDYEASDKTELSFAVGDVVEFLEEADGGWVSAKSSDGLEGQVPSNYFKEMPLPQSEPEDDEAEESEPEQ